MSKELSRICLTVVMPASGRKKPKWSGKSAIGAGDRLAARQVFGLEVSPSVARMNFALALAVAGLAFSASSVFVTSPGAADGDMDVVGLEDAAQVGLVRRARAQPLERRLLVAEGFKEGERELRGVERLLREAEMASSISTAFNSSPPLACRGVFRRGAAASPLCSATYSRMNCRST